MEKKEVEKTIDTKFKNRLRNIVIPNCSITIKNRVLEITNQETSAIGEVRYEFSSGKLCGIGAVTTLHMSACVHKCEIDDVFNKSGIVEKISPHYLFLPFYTRRYKFQKSEKYSGGEDFHFYPSDDLEKRIDEFILPIENDILPRIEHFLNHKMELLKDIISCQDYYKYPFATMLVALHLNNQATIAAVTDILNLAEINNLYDLKYKGFLEKINSHFGT